MSLMSSASAKTELVAFPKWSVHCHVHFLSDALNVFELREENQITAQILHLF